MERSFSRTPQAVEGAINSLRRISDSGDQPTAVRALWALYALGARDEKDLIHTLSSTHEFVRAWAVRFLCEERMATPEPLRRYALLARGDKSPLVRLSLAAALQRLKPEQRWDVLTELVQHTEDADDHNLPLMYWYAAEACVASDPDRALELLKVCKIPKVREFIARRLAAISFTSAK